MKIEHASAKIRDAPPADDKADINGLKDVWAGKTNL